MMQKTYSFFFLFVIGSLLSACSVEAPNETEVKEKVYAYYQQQTENANGGSYNVQDVSVLSISEDTSGKDTFDATCIAKGFFRTTDASGNLKNQSFTDTLKMAMEWNGAKWITVPR